MAATVATNAYIAFGSNGSTTTEVDRSSYFSSVTMPKEMAEVDVTTFGDADQDFLAGLRGATISGEGNWDATINTHIDAILTNGDTVEFEFGPAGNTTGLPKFSGSMFVTSYEINDQVGDKIGFSVAFRLTGAVTLGTFA